MGTDDFRVRDEQVTRQYLELSRQLSKMSVEVIGLEARIVATDRFMTDTMKEQKGVISGVDAIRAELATQKDATKDYQGQIKDLKIAVETGKLQVGVGDESYDRDEQMRTEYNQIIARERQLKGGSGGSEFDRVFQRIAALEVRLDEHDALVDDVVKERVASMRTVLDEEKANLGIYRARLAELGTETETVVGGITEENFARVQKRFYNLVLKADVGSIDVSWAEREEHRMRVEMLTRERTRQVQSLDDEFREIMDETSERGKE